MKRAVLFSFSTAVVIVGSPVGCAPAEDGRQLDQGSESGGQGAGVGDPGAGGTAVSVGSGGAASSSGGSVAEGSGGVTTDPGPPKGPSAGCGDPHLDEPRGSYTDHEILGDREYFVRLPPDYDENRAYPLVFWGPGCGASGSEGTVIDGSVQDTVFVFLLSKVPSTPQCFSTDDSLEARPPELEYFDRVLEEVQGSYCTEKSQVFVSGYSSGSWLSHLLACHRGDVIRGIGSAAGGLHPPVEDCVGQVAAIMHAGTADGANPIEALDEFGVNHGSGAARDQRLLSNGCNPDVSQPWDPAYPDCVIYDEGCEANPVVWCVDGSNHSTGGDVSSSGFWKFWSELPQVP